MRHRIVRFEWLQRVDTGCRSRRPHRPQSDAYLTLPIARCLSARSPPAVSAILRHLGAVEPLVRDGIQTAPVDELRRRPAGQALALSRASYSPKQVIRRPADSGLSGIRIHVASRGSMSRCQTEGTMLANISRT